MKDKEVGSLIEQLELFSGKKVMFLENYQEMEGDILRAAKMLASLVGEDYKVKAKNLARKHSIRQEAVEAILKKDLINIINTKF